MPHQKANQVLKTEAARKTNATGVTKHPLPAGGPDYPILQLQQAIGNQAVQQLAKSCPVFPSRCPFGGACHTCPARVQTRLRVNQPGDIYEQEADRVADEVMRMPEPQPQRVCACGGRCPKCIEEQGDRKQMQAKHIEPIDAVATTVPPSIQEVTHSPGEALDLPTRKFMESRFGHDFSQVRIHSDALAQQSTRDVNARAYTVGHNVTFAVDEYSPNTYAGRHLLAHELAHVVQQSSGQPTEQIQRQEEKDAPSSTTSTLPTGSSPPAAGVVPTAEITLETGNIDAGFMNNLVHQQICVDGYGARTGAKQCFSFAATGFQLPQFSLTWLGWDIGVFGETLKGEVYNPKPVPSATVVSRHTLTAAQGATWLSYMRRTRLGLQDAYSVSLFNCRKFSQWEFRDASSHW